jgi:hypothetical protein
MGCTLSCQVPGGRDVRDITDGWSFTAANAFQSCINSAQIWTSGHGIAGMKLPGCVVQLCAREAEI